MFFNPRQGKITSLETGCRGPRKDRYHAHPHGHGGYGLLFTG